MEESIGRVVSLLIVVAVCATLLGITREIVKGKIEVVKLQQVENIGGKCVGVKQ